MVDNYWESGETVSFMISVRLRDMNWRRTILQVSTITRVQFNFTVILIKKDSVYLEIAETFH